MKLINKELILIFNFSEEEFKFKIPSKGKWYFLLDNEDLNLTREDNLKEKN